LYGALDGGATAFVVGVVGWLVGCYACSSGVRYFMYGIVRMEWKGRAFAFVLDGYLVFFSCIIYISPLFQKFQISFNLGLLCGSRQPLRVMA